MSRVYFTLASLFAIATLACSSSTPLKAGAAGGAGHPAAGITGMTTGEAGATGEAGMGEAGGGAAGTTDDAGAMDAAAGATATAGTNGAAGTWDAAAGTTGNTDTRVDSPSSFDVFVLPDASSDGAMLPDGRCVTGAFARDGVCVCQADAPIVCGASCTNPADDDDNCGFCGHVCGATSTCQHGTCGPPPITVVPAGAGCQAIGVAVSGANLFWTDKGHNRVSSVPVAGGAITNLSIAASAPTAIVATGGTAFWLESGARAIRSSSLAGPVLTVVTSATEIKNFTVSEDGTAVYFSTGTTIMKVPAVGGAVVPVVSEDDGGEPGALVVQGAFVAFPTAINGDVDIAKLIPGVTTSCGKNDPATGELLPNPNCNRVARSQGSLDLEVILIRVNRVFWADGTNLKANDMFSGIQNNENIAQTLNTDILGMAATASMLYFGEDGTVYKSPSVRDSIPVRIARGQSSPRSFAVDATRVYWSTGDCAIRATGL
jgi:hypothetical protein